MSLSSSLQPLRGSLRPSHLCLLSLPLRTAPKAIPIPASASRASPFSHTTIRHATHGAAGRANGPKNGPGRRLGAKKTADEYVIPGNIIFRQRGTHWYPGENVGMGRDHTIYALETGYVRYYKDPARHPDKKYIGIVLERAHTLPASRTEPRKRRLGMIAVPRKPSDAAAEEGEGEGDAQVQSSGGISVIPNPTDPSGRSVSVVQAASRRSRPTPSQLREIKRLVGNGRVPADQLKMRPNYSYRETNYEIGRAAERAGVMAPRYKPGDRFLAWRKRAMRQKARAEKRALGRKKAGERKGNKAKKN